MVCGAVADLIDPAGRLSLGPPRVLCLLRTPREISSVQRTTVRRIPARGGCCLVIFDPSLPLIQGPRPFGFRR